MTALKPFLTPLRRIAAPKGDVLHGMKRSDAGFIDFGEAYFSVARTGEVKGWKRHRVMTLNLICIAGATRFVVYDQAGDRLDTILSPDIEGRYQRLTVPPLCWVAFASTTHSDSMILNLASHLHDPAEAETAELPVFPWAPQA